MPTAVSSKLLTAMVQSNEAGHRVWPLIFRGCFRAFQACMETPDSGFVGIELHPHLFPGCAHPYRRVRGQRAQVAETVRVE